MFTDLVVITLVIRRMRATPLGFPGGPDRGKAIESAHALFGDSLRANCLGDPRHLPAALTGLLPQLRDLLRNRGIDPRPEVARALVEVSAARHRIATSQQLREALATIG